jgi:hypothetical protein
MEPLTAYRVRGYAANLSALRTCCPAHRSHASGRVFQVHGVVGVFSVHVSRRVQRNTVNGVGQNNSTEPAPGAQSEGIFAVVHSRHDMELAHFREIKHNDSRISLRVTASRNLKAASLGTTLSSHSITAMSPIFSICTLRMTSFHPCPIALRARAVPSNCSLHFVLG